MTDVPPPPGRPPGPPPPPPGPPPGPPPPPPPPPARDEHSTARTLLIVLAAVGMVALLVVVAALVVLLLADDGDGDRSDGASEGPDPARVVEELVAAAGDDDCGAAEQLVTEEVRESEPCSTEEWALLASEDVESEIDTAIVEGDHATVAATFTSPQGASEYTFSLERVGEEWLVSGFRPGAAVESDSPGTTDPTDTASTADPTETTVPPTEGATGLPAGDPAEVVEDYITAYFAGDCVTADSLVTERYLEEEGACSEEDADPNVIKDIEFKVRRATIDEDERTARVPVTITFDDLSDTSDFALVVVGDRWKVDQAPQ